MAAVNIIILAAQPGAGTAAPVAGKAPSVALRRAVNQLAERIEASKMDALPKVFRSSISAQKPLITEKLLSRIPILSKSNIVPIGRVLREASFASLAFRAGSLKLIYYFAA